VGVQTFLLIVSVLLPLVRRYGCPWTEVCIYSNDFKYEGGVNVHFRHYLQPWIWWVRSSATTSIEGGAMLMKQFMKLRLPKLILDDGNFNYAGYWPYYMSEGPLFYVYTPPKSRTVSGILGDMAWEEASLAREAPMHSIPKGVKRTIFKTYSTSFKQGRFLSKKERLCMRAA